MASRPQDQLGESGITKDTLVGLRVQVGIDEPEDASRLGWLSGTITRKLPGGGPSHVVLSTIRLDTLTPIATLSPKK